MPEIRYNIVSREWVIIATERAKRPEQFAAATEKRAALPRYSPTDALCPGNEAMTPPEVARIERNGAWQVRVVPNKFPALSPVGEPTRHLEYLKRTINGVGLHEVIVETPRHDLSLAMLPQEDVNDVVTMYQRRYDAVTSDPRVAHATLFKNYGDRAGSSLEHSHSQIVGTPIIPPQVRQRMEAALHFYDQTGTCVICAMIADETASKVRMVAETDDCISFAPFASASPFHLWICPRNHQASFSEATPPQLKCLATMLRTILRKLHFGLNDPDYNLMLRTPPKESSGMRYFHWYMSVTPRVTRVAGFEIGSGMFINTALPEESAAFLRNAPTDPL